jgi:hypothetical protein
MRTKKILALSILSLLLTACAAINSSAPTPIPTPASTLIEQFIWQTDGLCGYRILRPEGWAASESECRAYMLPGSEGQTDQLFLRVANYQVLAQQQTEGIIAQYELFKQDPSLAGWTKGVEQMWQSNGIESTLEATRPQAKIYSLRSPGSSDVQIIALSIHQEQPLVLSLNASGEYADLERLRDEHLWDDFVTMVDSLGSTGYNPNNITPSLP